MSPLCRTVDEVRAAARRDGADDPPLTQAQADLVAAILASSPKRENPPASGKDAA